MPNIHDVADDFTRFIAICSLLHTVLPPWEILNDFPGIQKYYKVLVYSIGYAGLNARSAVYASLSTKNGHAKSVAAKKKKRAVKRP